jgi:periplasmic divalent cation tolerance protein
LKVFVYVMRTRPDYREADYTRPQPPEFYMTDKRLVMTTAGSPTEARNLANVLVERQLAACVTILPSVSSIYRWKGEVAEAEEVLLLIKTTEAAFERVYQTIRELHSYQTPECISLPIDQGSVDYLKWIEESVNLSAKTKSEF